MNSTEPNGHATRSPIAALLTELSEELDGWSDTEAAMVLAVADGWEPDPVTVLWCKHKLEAAIAAQVEVFAQEYAHPWRQYVIRILKGEP